MPAALLSKRSQELPKKPSLGFDVAGGGLGKVSSEQVGNPGTISVPEAWVGVPWRVCGVISKDRTSHGPLQGNVQG